MSSSLKISIVTPSYNQGKFIEETILSVINQGYPNTEYIIIDGGSTDNSLEIIKKYSEYIAFWVSEKDSGQSEAINKGFMQASGDIICWLNSDDILLPGALNKVACCFENNKELDLINGHLLLIDEYSHVLSSHFILKQKKWYARHGIYYISQPSMFWRRHILDSIGLLKKEFHSQMDKELLIRIFENNYRIGHVKKILAGFRMHRDSKSSLGGESEDCVRDALELQKLYGKGYGRKPKLIFKLIYSLEKLIKGVYLKKWFFTLKWKGRKVSELNQNNCAYL